MKLDSVSKLFYENFRIPICFVTAQGQPIFQCPTYSKRNPLNLNPSEFLAHLSVPTTASTLPIITMSPWLERYATIPLTGRGQGGGAIIVGPFLYSEVSDEMLRELFQLYNIPGIHLESAEAYYLTVSTRSKMSVLLAIAMLYYLVYESEIEISDIREEPPLFGSWKNGALSTDKVELDLSDRRQDFALHHHPIVEKALMRCVQDGNKAELVQRFHAISREKLGVLSKKSRLRNEKNLAICAITLGTRAAMDGGLYPEMAYMLSDLYIQYIEDLADVPAVVQATLEALCDFAERVHKHRGIHHSAAVAACKNYIFNHLFEEITISQLSATAGLSGGHLSQTFKKEVGVTISEYIQQERIEEAKKLLTLTDLPLSHICNRLTFHDQSYFTKVFKKLTGMTPKRYRTMIR
jgi:AraC-like DNA-binding protein